MKIDFIISSIYGGGAERVLAIIANTLAKKKSYEVSIITLNKGNDKYDIDKSINRVRLEHGTIPNHTVRGFVNLCKYYFRKKNRPDLIISFLTLNNFLAIIVAKLYSIKIIAEEHNSHLRFINNRKATSNFTKKYLYKRADLLTVLTSYDLSYYENFGVNVYVMPNPCSFVPIKTNTHSREKIILAVGNLNRYHHKGFDNLIELIAPILKKNSDWKLKIAGSGDKGLPILKELIEQFGIDSQVIFTGFVSNISDIMHKSSIYILPSRYEGLPMVLLEAMSQGMACIAYDCITGPADIITDHVNGFLIEDQNKEAMQRKLQILIDDDSLRNRFATQSLKSLDKYHINSIIKRYENIFDRLLLKK
ncbi:glycosyltransferase family 4 protein [Algibacter mikhailovii]|uniref:glycosyltransferase family 4 protein n=1 Tax=Algibacter mikhailovii TaxID=425498 RepID=UPI00249579AE|nr:glycosyltransferase family 4 protein [Algibacter mikhailovii]